MKYQAIAKYIRQTPRKMRLVADVVRDMTATEAMRYLYIHPKRASKALRQVIQSAVANAKQKNIAEDTLSIDTIDVMKGPAMKRWRAVSRGRAHQYKKNMCHVKVVLKAKEDKKIQPTKKQESQTKKHNKDIQANKGGRKKDTA